MKTEGSSGLLAQEPFRLFFPLGALATAGGAFLWPLFHHHLLPYYPGLAHARLMSAGLGGFILGFLLTACPRLTSSPSLHRSELAALLSLWLAAIGLYACNKVAPGDAAFSASLLFSLILLVGRWGFFGRDTPPPGMPVALLGLLVGAGASAALAWEGGAWLGMHGLLAAKVLLYQALPLLPLIGIGPFLLPRFFGHGSGHSFPDSRRPPAGWWRKALVPTVAGVIVVVSIGMEAGGAARSGFVLRALAVAVALGGSAGLFRKATRLSTPGTAIRFAGASLLAGLAWASLDPDRRVGILHFLFVSGLGLAMLAVGVRVIAGHAGRHDLLEKKIVWLRVVIGLALLTAATRVSADFLPRIRWSHLDYAALTWAAVVALWLWKLGRHLRSEGRSPAPSPGRCPKPRRRGKGNPRGTAQAG